jgi:hypothetical protein
MENRVNLSPMHWGPKTWFFLESAAMAYPVSPTDNEKTSAKYLLLSLQDMLPCETCRINYTSYLKETIDGNYLDEVVKDRDSFLTFMIDLHNDVRTKNGQSTRSMEDVFNYYAAEYRKKPVSAVETFVDINNLNKSKNDIIKSLDMNKNTVIENYDSLSSDLLFHFNPITLFIGFLIGLIAYKFFLENYSKSS